MPQLIPFFFVNQVLSNFALLTIIFCALFILGFFLGIYLCGRTTPLLSQPPRPYSFITYTQNSAMDQIVVTAVAAGIFHPIILRSAFLFAAAIFITSFRDHIPSIFAPTLIYYMERVLENSQHIHRLVSAYLENPNISHNMLSQLHQYLTPYIRSHESVWTSMLASIVNHLERTGSSYFDEVDVLFEELREVGNGLLELYRNIERSLNISIQDSPISSQWSEN